MVAASRRPRLRPCAPIGGNDMRRLADQRDPACAETRVRSRPPAETRHGRARSAILPRIECERRSISAAISRVGERGEARGVGRIDHEDQARASPRERHQGERPGLGVELGRGVVVRPAWPRLKVSAVCG